MCACGDPLSVSHDREERSLVLLLVCEREGSHGAAMEAVIKGDKLRGSLDRLGLIEGVQARVDLRPLRKGVVQATGCLYALLIECSRKDAPLEKMI